MNHTPQGQELCGTLLQIYPQNEPRYKLHCLDLSLSDVGIYALSQCYTWCCLCNLYYAVATVAWEIKYCIMQQRVIKFGPIGRGSFALLL